MSWLDTMRRLYGSDETALVRETALRLFRAHHSSRGAPVAHIPPEEQEPWERRARNLLKAS